MSPNRSSFLSCFLTSILLLFVNEYGIRIVSGAISCTLPNGLKNGNAGFNEIDQNGITLPLDGIYNEFLDKIKSSFLGNYEGPVAHRLILLSTSVSFSSMSAYEEKSLDFWGRKDLSNERRRCQIGFNNDAERSLHRRVTLAYASFFGLSKFIPESKAELKKIMDGYNLPTDVCNNPNYDCTDVGSPWGFAKLLVNEVFEFGKYDGFNADGSLSREYNKIPYQDFRGNDRYIPRNNPWRLRHERYWQPLLESDGKGFLFNQEHVTPHIGWTAKSIFLGDDDICQRQVGSPFYNYNQEIQTTLDILANLDDKQKMEIELFDNKVASIVGMVGQFNKQQNIAVDSFEYISADVMTLATLYECVIVSWKEKVHFNAVRPPSIVHARKQNVDVTSYAGRSAEGKTFGTQTFKGDQWEPYIRTMPHAEYPSGSACLCSAYASALKQWTGVDDFTSLSGIISRTYAPLSSRLEPLSTPAQSVTLNFEKWSEISTRCGQSRLNGGMHFSKAVPASATMCESIGDIVAKSFQKIISGEKPDFVADIDDNNIPNRRC